MNRDILRNLVSILKESPLYKTLSGDEKRTLINHLTEKYAFLNDDNRDIVGYESSWADIIHNEMSLEAPHHQGNEETDY